MIAHNKTIKPYTYINLKSTGGFKYGVFIGTMPEYGGLDAFWELAEAVTLTPEGRKEKKWEQTNIIGAYWMNAIGDFSDCKHLSPTELQTAIEVAKANGVVPYEEVIVP